MIPVTPTSNTFSLETVAESQGTPLGLDYDGEDDQQNRIRYLIAQSMNSEMLLCKINPFLQDYGPPQPSTEDVAECISTLEHAHFLTTTNDGIKWADFQRNPSAMPEVENDAFKPLVKIVEEIFKYAGARRHNQYEYVRLPYAWCQSDIAGANHKMDGCIVEKYLRGALPSDNAMVPFEFKKARTTADRIDVREQIVGDCQHIMNNDPTRMFIYGVTIEDDRLSVWYFSRSHSVKAISFNWLSNSSDERGIHLFIQLFLSFALATPEQLGVDPNVIKARRITMMEPQQYIYMYPRTEDEYAAALEELDEQHVTESLSAFDEGSSESKPSQTSRQSVRLATKAATIAAERTKSKKLEEARLAVAARETAKFRYFKTINHIGPLRPYCISGRVTRIWRVHEIASASDETPLTNRVLILKDVWLDATRSTETENMEAISSDLEELLKLAKEKYAGDDWLDQFLDKNSRFSEFDRTTKDRLKTVLTNGNYKSLFLTKVVAWTGQTCKVLSGMAKLGAENDKVFAERDTSTRLKVLRANTQFGSDSRQAVTGDRKPPKPADVMDLNPRLGRRYAQKQQSRFVYEEVCTELHNLQTLGNFVRIIDQALTASQVLFCAGWVHRDISRGNVLAFETGPGRWTVKLCDLEFAQRMGHGKHHSDPRTGTPFFMPYEIMDRKLVLERYRGEPDPEASLAKGLNQLTKGSPEYDYFKEFQRFPGRDITSVPANARIGQAPKPNAIPQHNYQHDLESIWWLVLYFMMCGVEHAPSKQHAKSIFVRSLTCSDKRATTFNHTILGLKSIVHPKLAPGFLTDMNTLRAKLLRGYLELEVFGLLNQNKAYSGIHATFATTFRELLAKNEGDWQGIPLVNPTDDPRTLRTKRPRRESDTDEEDEAEVRNSLLVKDDPKASLPPPKKIKLEDSDDEE